MSWLKDVLRRVGNHLESWFNKQSGYGLTNAEQQAMDFNAAEAEKARHWQEQFYTNYQSPSAMMQQYREAGINPMMVANGGHVSSPPPAQTASVNMPVGGDGTGLLELIRQMALMKAQIRLVNSQAALNEREAVNVGRSGNWIDRLNEALVNSSRSAVERNLASARESVAHAELMGNQVRVGNATIELSRAQIAELNARAELSATQSVLNGLTAERLRLIMPYVAPLERAELALKQASTDETRQRAIAEYASASASLAQAALSEHIVSADVYGSMARAYGASADVSEARRVLTDWQSRVTKRGYHWMPVDKTIATLSSAVRMATQIYGMTVMPAAGPLSGMLSSWTSSSTVGGLDFDN